MITDELKEKLEAVLRDAINNPDYEINQSTFNDELEFNIDTVQPVTGRPNKRSKILIIKFSKEFFDDRTYQNSSLMAQIELQVKHVFDKFNFENKNAHGEPQPTQAFAVTSMGEIKESSTT